uniref:Uncharacterized protein n=1 Tax=Anguilla anguilla TaxID=7936 RepID=A0A0E9PB72_ANGAN
MVYSFTAMRMILRYPVGSKVYIHLGQSYSNSHSCYHTSPVLSQLGVSTLFP